MKNYTVNEVILYFIIPNLNLLESGKVFVLEDLTPPIIWNNFIHTTLGATFGDIIKDYSLPVIRVNKSGTAEYKKF